MLKVLIVDDAPLTLTNIERLLSGADGMEACGTAQDGGEALRMVQSTSPNVVLIDMDLQRGEGLKTAQQITRMAPSTAVIVMGLDDDPGTRRMVQEAGARAYLVKPFGGAELLTVLRQVGNLPTTPGAPAAGVPAPAPMALPPYAAGPFGPPPAPQPTGPPPFGAPSRGPLPPPVMPPAAGPFGAPPPMPSMPAAASGPQLAPPPGPPAMPPAPMAAPAAMPPTPPAPPMAPSAVPLAGGAMGPVPAVAPSTPSAPASQAGNGGGQIIAVISGKGGVGTSVVATNLALLAAAEGHRRVSLIDFDLQHGDIRRMLRVDGPEGVLDLARVSPNVDRGELTRRLVSGPGGIQVLLAPSRPSLEADVTPGFVAALLLQLRFGAQDVIVDLAPHISPASVAALQGADKVVLISSMSDPGVRATQGMLRLFAEIGIPSQHIIVVLNRTEANSDLTKPAVEEALGRPVITQLPYDPILVSTSINRGSPFVLHKPDSQASRKLREVATALFNVPVIGDETAAAHPPTVPPMAERLDADDEPRRKKKGLFGRR